MSHHRDAVPPEHRRLSTRPSNHESTAPEPNTIQQSNGSTLTNPLALRASEIEVYASDLLDASYNIGNFPELRELSAHLRHRLDLFDDMIPPERLANIGKRNVVTADPNAEDFHVYIDGALSHVVPCGVCGTNQAGDPDHDERKRLFAHYGIKSPALREVVRDKMEDLLKRTHPASTVAVL